MRRGVCWERGPEAEHAAGAAACGRERVAGALTGHVEVPSDQFQGRAQVGREGGEVEQDSATALVVQVGVDVNGGEQDEAKSVMAHRGSQEVRGVVLHSGLRGWVLEGAAPAHHEASSAAFGGAGVVGVT